jgi:hypothetical protein
MTGDNHGHDHDHRSSCNPTKQQGGYGSIAIKEWLRPELSETSSTCCSSTCEEDMTLSSVHSSNMTSPDEDDPTFKPVRDHGRQDQEDPISQVGTMLKYQATFMTASTCTTSSCSLEDDMAVDSDVEMGQGVVVVSSKQCRISECDTGCVFDMEVFRLLLTFFGLALF